MHQVLLQSWQPGFVANRLIGLLREQGLSLDEAHAMVARFCNGEKVAIQIATDSAAEQFARDARSLNITLEVHRTAIAS